MTAIADCIRVALQNCGNTDVIFTNDKLMKRRRSRTQKLDLPTGMHRNLSESQLVQAGSKAVSNVAEQFSKFGQTFNPKILTGKKVSESVSISKAGSSDQSPDEQPDSIPIHTADEVATNADGDNVCSDNPFLQSVGIVMVDAGKLDESSSDLPETRKPSKVLLKNVSKMSISSVTDNVNMPPEMLDIGDASVATGTATTPVISVQETAEDGLTAVPSDGLKMCRSVSDMRSDFNDAIDESRYASKPIKCCSPLSSKLSTKLNCFAIV